MEAVFDTHAYVKRLVTAGMPEPQAEVIADEQRGLIDDKLATKRDLKELEVALKRDIAEVKRSIKELEAATKRDMKEMEARLEDRITVNILKWTFAALLGQTAVLAALVKLL